MPIIISLREGEARNPFGDRKADCGNDEEQPAEDDDYTDELANGREYHQRICSRKRASAWAPYGA